MKNAFKIAVGKLAAGDRASATLPVALAAAALVPTVCVLWFMSVAMRNERLAVQERMADVYANQLAALQRQANAFWKERQAALATAGGASAAEKFAAIVRGGLADGVVIQDGAGKSLYPGPAALEAPVEEKGEWAAAREQEFQKKDFAAAAVAYAKIAESSRDIHTKARALLAEAGARLKAGDKPAAIVRLSRVAGDPTLRHAISAQGTLIAPNAQLLLIKTIAGGTTSASSAGDQAARAEAGPPMSHLRARTLDDLVARSNDYAESPLPAAQRRFLMHELKSLAPEIALPTLAAEDLAADYLETNAALAGATARDGRSKTASLQSTPLQRVWRLALADRTLVALFREERLKAEMSTLFEAAASPDVRVRLLAPGEAFTSGKLVPPLEAGEFLPGWRLGLSFRHGDTLAEASARQKQFYLWTGFVVVVVIALLALLVARTVNAQMRLARMKNELVSTVSHELKTPLASMRALVETLAAGHYRDERQLREYLELIARENLRLSGLIDNFLTFSRLERGRHQFHFERLEPARVVDDAVVALREKLHAANCTFARRVDPDLPRIRGDAGALSTVLINLLDNAHKYTDADKRISARAFAQNGHVCFEVSDNGIGIPRQETARIFDRFYQIDQSLTRQRGGCGLGLGIVQYIVRAHDGSVEVESEPGKGSVFRVKIPTETRNAEICTTKPTSLT